MSWIDQFLSKIEKKSENECWEWKGTKSSRKDDQYGKIVIEGKIHRTHRIAYALAHNIKIPYEGHVLHKCDNPTCCNPNHLWLGSHRDNMRDMKEKGRAKGGHNSDVSRERNGNSKLTNEDVEEIKLLLKEKLTNKEIAKRYNVTHHAISCIKRGINWA